MDPDKSKVPPPAKEADDDITVLGVGPHEAESEEDRVLNGDDKGSSSVSTQRPLRLSFSSTGTADSQKTQKSAASVPSATPRSKKSFPAMPGIVLPRDRAQSLSVSGSKSIVVTLSDTISKETPGGEKVNGEHEAQEKNGPEETENGARSGTPDTELKDPCENGSLSGDGEPESETSETSTSPEPDERPPPLEPVFDDRYDHYLEKPDVIHWLGTRIGNARQRALLQRFLSDFPHLRPEQQAHPDVGYFTEDDVDLSHFRRLFARFEDAFNTEGLLPYDDRPQQFDVDPVVRVGARYLEMSDDAWEYFRGRLFDLLPGLVQRNRDAPTPEDALNSLSPAELYLFENLRLAQMAGVPPGEISALYNLVPSDEEWQDQPPIPDFDFLGLVGVQPDVTDYVFKFIRDRFDIFAALSFHVGLSPAMQKRFERFRNGVEKRQSPAYKAKKAYSVLESRLRQAQTLTVPPLVLKRTPKVSSKSPKPLKSPTPDASTSAAPVAPPPVVPQPSPVHSDHGSTSSVVTAPAPSAPPKRRASSIVPPVRIPPEMWARISPPSLKYTTEFFSLLTHFYPEFVDYIKLWWEAPTRERFRKSITFNEPAERNDHVMAQCLLWRLNRAVKRNETIRDLKPPSVRNLEAAFPKPDYFVQLKTIYSEKKAPGGPVKIQEFLDRDGNRCFEHLAKMHQSWDVSMWREINGLLAELDKMLLPKVVVSVPSQVATQGTSGGAAPASSASFGHARMQLKSLPRSEKDRLASTSSESMHSVFTDEADECDIEMGSDRADTPLPSRLQSSQGSSSFVTAPDGASRKPSTSGFQPSGLISGSGGSQPKPGVAKQPQNGDSSDPEVIFQGQSQPRQAGEQSIGLSPEIVELLRSVPPPDGPYPTAFAVDISEYRMKVSGMVHSRRQNGLWVDQVEHRDAQFAAQLRAAGESFIASRRDPRDPRCPYENGVLLHGQRWPDAVSYVLVELFFYNDALDLSQPNETDHPGFFDPEEKWKFLCNSTRLGPVRELFATELFAAFYAAARDQKARTLYGDTIESGFRQFTVTDVLFLDGSPAFGTGRLLPQGDSRTPENYCAWKPRSNYTNRVGDAVFIASTFFDSPAGAKPTAVANVAKHDTLVFSDSKNRGVRDAMRTMPNFPVESTRFQEDRMTFSRALVHFHSNPFGHPELVQPFKFFIFLLGETDLRRYTVTDMMHLWDAAIRTLPAEAEILFNWIPCRPSDGPSHRTKIADHNTTMSEYLGGHIERKRVSVVGFPTCTPDGTPQEKALWESYFNGAQACGLSHAARKAWAKVIVSVIQRHNLRILTELTQKQKIQQKADAIIGAAHGIPIIPTSPAAQAGTSGTQPSTSAGTSGVSRQLTGPAHAMKIAPIIPLPPLVPLNTSDRVVAPQQYPTVDQKFLSNLVELVVPYAVNTWYQPSDARAKEIRDLRADLYNAQINTRDNNGAFILVNAEKCVCGDTQEVLNINGNELEIVLRMPDYDPKRELSPDDKKRVLEWFQIALMNPHRPGIRPGRPPYDPNTKVTGVGTNDPVLHGVSWSHTGSIRFSVHVDAWPTYRAAQFYTEQMRQNPRLAQLVAITQEFLEANGLGFADNNGVSLSSKAVKQLCCCVMLEHGVLPDLHARQLDPANRHKEKFLERKLGGHSGCDFYDLACSFIEPNRFDVPYHFFDPDKNEFLSLWLATLHYIINLTIDIMTVLRRSDRPHEPDSYLIARDHPSLSAGFIEECLTDAMKAPICVQDIYQKRNLTVRLPQAYADKLVKTAESVRKALLETRPDRLYDLLGGPNIRYSEVVRFMVTGKTLSSAASVHPSPPSPPKRNKPDSSGGPSGPGTSGWRPMPKDGAGGSGTSGPAVSNLPSGSGSVSGNKTAKTAAVAKQPGSTESKSKIPVIRKDQSSDRQSNRTVAVDPSDPLGLKVVTEVAVYKPAPPVRDLSKFVSVQRTWRDTARGFTPPASPHEGGTHSALPVVKFTRKDFESQKRRDPPSPERSREKGRPKTSRDHSTSSSSTGGESRDFATEMWEVNSTCTDISTEILGDVETLGYHERERARIADWHVPKTRHLHTIHVELESIRPGRREQIPDYNNNELKFDTVCWRCLAVNDHLGHQCPKFKVKIMIPFCPPCKENGEGNWEIDCPKHSCQFCNSRDHVTAKCPKKKGKLPCQCCGRYNHGLLYCPTPGPFCSRTEACRENHPRHLDSFCPTIRDKDFQCPVCGSEDHVGRPCDPSDLEFLARERALYRDRELNYRNGHLEHEERVERSRQYRPEPSHREQKREEYRRLNAPSPPVPLFGHPKHAQAAAASAGWNTNQGPSTSQGFGSGGYGGDKYRARGSFGYSVPRGGFQGGQAVSRDFGTPSGRFQRGGYSGQSNRGTSQPLPHGVQPNQCLKCGGIGHFKRDCPSKDTFKRGHDDDESPKRGRGNWGWRGGPGSGGFRS